MIRIITLRYEVRYFFALHKTYHNIYCDVVLLFFVGFCFFCCLFLEGGGGSELIIVNVASKYDRLMSSDKSLCSFVCMNIEDCVLYLYYRTTQTIKKCKVVFSSDTHVYIQYRHWPLSSKCLCAVLYIH